MVVSIDLPAFTMQIIHEEKTIEVFKDEQGHFGLRHPVTNMSLNVMLTTGGGTKAIGVVQPHGVIEFPATTLKIKVRQDMKKVPFAYHAIFSFWVNREGEGMRPAGDFSLDAIGFVKKIVANAAYKCDADLYVAAAESDTTKVQVVLQTKDSDTTPVQMCIHKLAAWLHTDLDAQRLLTTRMVSRSEVANKLSTFAIERLQKTSDKLNGLYGGMNTLLALVNMDTSRDTLRTTAKVDPTQLMYMLFKYNMNRDMARKNAVAIARSAVLAMAELCACERDVDANGEHAITIQDFMHFVKTAPAKPALYAKYIGILENVFTGFDAAMREYVNDEQFEFFGDTLRPSAVCGEKMDVACGRSSMTFAVLRAQIEANAKLIKNHREEMSKLDPANATHAAQIRLHTELLGQATGKQFQLRRSYFNTDGDCEDGGFYTVCAMRLLQVYPGIIQGHVNPFVGKTFMSVHMAFSDPAETDIKTLTEQLQRLVQGSIQFASDALKWQSTSVPGKLTEYLPAFGFASAPSCPVKTEPEPALGPKTSAITLSRETCDTHDDWISKTLEGRQLAGHCFAVKVVSTPGKKADHFCTSQAQVSVRGILESTVPNFRKMQEEVTADRRLADKSVEVTVGGMHGRLCRVSHEKARIAIGDAASKKLISSLVNELTIKQPQDLEPLAKNFYNVFAHIGSKFCVSAEFTDGLVTKTITSLAAEAQIHRNCPPNVSFSASTLAWNASPTATETTSVVLTSELAEQEKRMLDAMVEETSQVHWMTDEELTFGMEKTGHYVNLGFVNGKFVGTDYTGGRLDSDKKIALHLILRLTEAGAGLPEYWNSAAGARSVVEGKLKEVLPDARVRVKEIETGLFSAQVVLDAEK